jgi:hypothetical protein
MVSFPRASIHEPMLCMRHGFFQRSNQSMRRTNLQRVLLAGMMFSATMSAYSLAQKAVRKPDRTKPPQFRSDEFAGVFFADAKSQLQGTASLGSPTPEAESSMSQGEGDSGDAEVLAKGNEVWKQLISGSTIEDLVKESKSRVDGIITTPAKFASGGYGEARREFTLLGSLMGIIAQYPEEIRWKSSAPYARTAFARMAANCKVGTQPVYNEAKLRQQDLQDLLKGTKLNGTPEETAWADTADRGPTMQILEWALRENLAPHTSNEDNFGNNLDEIAKYAELVAAYGQILQLEGMTDADDETYAQYSAAMVSAAKETLKAVKSKDAELARTAVSKIDQSCNKCHETYR